MSAFNGHETDVVALCTSFNRKNSTLSAITQVLESTPEAVQMTVVLCDDASTDGTPETVLAHFDDSVRLTSGTGELFWAGGMAHAYNFAQRLGQPTAYFLFNDDVDFDVAALRRFFEAGLSELAETKAVAWVGQTIDLNGVITYGGFNRVSPLRPLSFTRVEGSVDGVTCDTFNANAVLIAGWALRQVDGLDGRFRHAFADLDLGLRLLNAGGELVVCREPVGVCLPGNSLNTRLSKFPRSRRVREVLLGPLGIGPRLRMSWRHGAKMMAPVYLGRQFIWAIRILIPPAAR